jgi:hypothetical protein
LRTDGIFIRAQSAIRADGIRPRNVPHGCLSTAHTVSHATRDLRAARANRIFCTDKMHPCRKRGFA